MNDTLRVEPPAIAALTFRQQEILALLARGQANAAIARCLGLTERTVRNQISLIYRRLGIPNDDPGLNARVVAVRLALQAASAPLEAARPNDPRQSDRLIDRLNVVVGYLDLLAESVELAPLHREWARIALLAAEALAADVRNRRPPGGPVAAAALNSAEPDLDWPRAAARPADRAADPGEPGRP